MAPVALSVAVPPGQIVAGEALAFTTGGDTTKTVSVRVAVHPLALAPIAVYVMVAPGVTMMPEPVKPPGFQV